jgi:hypothetical protein
MVDPCLIFCNCISKMASLLPAGRREAVGHPSIVLLSNFHQANEEPIFKCRFLMLTEGVRWKCTIDAGILKSSAIVRTENHGSASNTCRIRASISSRGGRPELGRTLRSERCNLISCSQCFILFSSNASSWSTHASSATITGSFIPLGWRWLTICLYLISICNSKQLL